MSLLDTFDPAEELIKPALQRSFRKDETLPELVIATFKEETFRMMGTEYPVEQVAVLRAGRTIPVYKLQWRGHEIGIFHTMMGGPAAVCLQESVLARGCRKLLYYGNCGVLCKEIAAGHLIVPSAAYRDEGTSYHYLPAGDYVEIPTCRRMAEIMEELHLPCVTGRVWTTDAFYRETRRNMEARRAEGCIAVDMECASVMAAGQFRGAEIYQFLYADDCLDGEAWDPRTLGARPDSTHEEYLRLALEIAVRLL